MWRARAGMWDASGRSRNVNQRLYEWAQARGQHALLLVALATVLSLAALGGCASTTSTEARATATPTAQQRFAALARNAIGGRADTVTATYDAQTGVLQVLATIGGAIARAPSDIAASQERVKALCFVAQRALWTSGPTFTEVKITVLGPLLDDYFDQITDWYGVADLTARTAAKLDWGTLTADSAWSAYDNVSLRTAYAPFQDWGAPTPTPA